MPRENKTRFALLGMLTYGPMSGYDMKKMSDQSIGHFWNENYGNIYPVLKKMESEKLVTMTKQDRDGGPGKKVYSITNEGREVLGSWLERPVDSHKLREELLLKVFFGQWTDPTVIIGKIREEDARCAGEMEVLEEIKAHMEQGHAAGGRECAGGDCLDGDRPEKGPGPMKAGAPYWKLTVEFGLRYYAGIRDWCADALETLENLRSDSGFPGGGNADSRRIEA